MKKALFFLTFIFIAAIHANAQNKYKYYFAEHGVSYTAEQLTEGIKLPLNDSCYYLFQFYDTRKSTIVQTKYCNGNKEDIIRYTVPKELTPYENKGIKEKVYWIKLN